MKLTLVIDPRFSGGTSSAVAREINVLAADYQLSLAAISSRHFKGKDVHPAIEEACDQTGTPLVWDPPFVSADVVALHNPSFLKFNSDLNTKLHCDRLFVVCHENFLRPSGAEGFDVGNCLSLISDAALCRRKFLMPVSDWNRQGIEAWIAENPSTWAIGPGQWFNICDFEMIQPTTAPRDRRGRHSRAGHEKFPGPSAMAACFPPTAEAVRIMGADSLLQEDHPENWELLPFGAESVPQFLQSIDFFVYFTSPMLQESFGRVVGEAIAAGKVVITNPETAMNFGQGVIAAQPEEVHDIIARLIADPPAYAAQVLQAQNQLKNFSADAFRAELATLLTATDRRKTDKTELEAIYDFL